MSARSRHVWRWGASIAVAAVIVSACATPRSGNSRIVGEITSTVVAPTTSGRTLTATDTTPPLSTPDKIDITPIGCVSASQQGSEVRLVCDVPPPIKASDAANQNLPWWATVDIAPTRAAEAATDVIRQCHRDGRALTRLEVELQASKSDDYGHKSITTTGRLVLTESALQKINADGQFDVLKIADVWEYPVSS